MTQTYYAPAKVNLWLRVFRSDHTGYHPLDTLFCAIDLSDRIEINPAAAGIQLHVLGADLGPPETNLAYRAALEYYHAIGAAPAIEMVLHKRIAAGAGLGGGSSDAATVLRALQQMHDHRLPEADLFA
jgi:4-diphosphocytidyl-2-C-methyl-D-erythritol kinase